MTKNLDKIGDTGILVDANSGNLNITIKNDSKNIEEAMGQVISSSMERLENIHPGEILHYEFLKPLNISAYRISKDLNIPQTRISQIIKGNRRITADTALRLSKYFGNSAKFWLGIQDDYDIEEETFSKKKELNNIVKFDNRNVA